LPLAERCCHTPAGRAPEGCPTRGYQADIDEAVRQTCSQALKSFACQAALQEAEGYGDRFPGTGRVRPIKTRLEETVEFARRMEYRRLGLAFCMGLRREARLVERLLVERGFEVASALCKIGCVAKETLGLDAHQKIAVGQFEAMCNPVAQARVLNRVRTEFNIVLGLCVGHDSLFLRHAEAPCTVLAVKDRVLGHNPLAAVYTLESTYRAIA
jgi:uncharacterized metal-binding protein